MGVTARVALWFVAFVQLCGTVESGTKVRLVGCAGSIRLQKLDFTSHLTWDQIRQRFSLAQRYHQRIALYPRLNVKTTPTPAAAAVKTLEALREEDVVTAVVTGCYGHGLDDNHGGRAALFQIPLSVPNLTTGEPILASVVVREGDTSEAAAEGFCWRHGVVNCSPLYNLIHQRMLMEVEQTRQPSTERPLEAQLWHASNAGSNSNGSLLPGLGHIVPDTWLPSDVAAEERVNPPDNLMRFFDRQDIPSLVPAWDACAAVYREAPAVPLRDMSSVWTATTAKHWELTHRRPIDLDVYRERELLDEERERGTAYIHLKLRQGHAEHCDRFGCLPLAQGVNLTDALASTPEIRNLPVPSEDMLARAARPQDHIKITHGSGWTTEASHLSFETERTMSSNTIGDLIGTAEADRYIKRFNDAMKTALGKGFIELRGLFLYGPHGFREWHSNMFDPPGWRMYFVHTKEAPGNRSWFSIRDPIDGIVYDVPDRDGQINLFRVSQEEPVWHSIVSKDAHRWSCGVHISDAAGEWLSKQLDTRQAIPR